MWNKFKEWRLPALWFAGIFALAGFTTTAFVWCDIFDDNWQYALFFFAISGGLLAVWGRLATHEQIKYSRKLIEVSQFSNRNDRFAKACEMLRQDSGGVAIRGGLNIFKDLRDENPESEYIRCTDILADWIVFNRDTKYAKLAFEIIFATKNSKQEKIVKASGLENEFKAYPFFSEGDLSGAKLSKVRSQKAKLSGLNLSNVDLSEADLSYADLCMADLSSAFLNEAYLIGAKLSKAQLSKVKLSRAYLIAAELSVASLYYANLSFADFSNANLSHADLHGANLHAALLSKANLSEANLHGANLSFADMKEVKNLTGEQIKWAKWYSYGSMGKPPKLPKELLDDEEVKKWLSEPHGNRPDDD